MQHEILTKIEKYNAKYGLKWDDKFKKYLINGDFANYSISKFTNLNPQDIDNLPFIDLYAKLGSIYHLIIEKTLKQEYINLEEQEKKWNETIKEEIENINIMTAKPWVLKKMNELKEYKWNDKVYTAKTFKQFQNKVKRKYKNYILIGSEITVLDRWKRVVGIIDLLIQDKKGNIIIVDFKTSKEIQLNHFLQIQLYTKILKSNYRISVDKLLITKIDLINNKLLDNKIPNISGNIWNNLPKECWIPPVDMFRTEENKKTQRISYF